MSEHIIAIIKHFLTGYVFRAKPSGLLPTTPDNRDFNTRILGWSGYTPKHSRHVIQTLSVKDQGSRNTCQWEATTVQKEVDEKIQLLRRIIIAWGKQNGLTEGDGSSELRSGQLALQRFGIAKSGFMDDTYRGWSDYTNINLKDSALAAESDKHRIQSFWFVNSREDILKLLDEGKVIVTGLDWYTGFNQGGGFRAPWLITGRVGYFVGGHAVAIIGYDLNYQGRKVYIIQNSYGAQWGDAGKFYIDMDYFDNPQVNYGFVANMDEIDPRVGRLLMDYDGKNVKHKDSPAVWFIQQGFKKVYPNWVTFLAYNEGGSKTQIYTVEKDALLQVPDKDAMDIKKSLYWPFLQNVKADKQIEALVRVISLGVSTPAEASEYLADLVN